MVQEGVLTENISDSLPNKKYFKIGEASTLLGVKPHVLRYWETEFPQIRPYKSKTGQRLYRRRDVEALIKIQKLLYEERFTIAGARQALRLNNWSSMPVDGMEEVPDEIDENLANEPVVLASQVPLVEAVPETVVKESSIEIQTEKLEVVAETPVVEVEPAVPEAVSVEPVIEMQVQELVAEAKVESAPLEIEEHQVVVEARPQEILASKEAVADVSSSGPLSEPAVEIKTEETVLVAEAAVVQAVPTEPVASVVAPVVETIAKDAVEAQAEEALENEMITESAVVEMLLEIQTVDEPVSEMLEPELISPKEKAFDSDMSRLLSMPLLTVKKELEELLRLLS